MGSVPETSGPDPVRNCASRGQLGKGLRSGGGQGAGGPGTGPSSKDPGLGGPPLRVPQGPKRPPLGSQPRVTARQAHPAAKAGKTRPLWLCRREAAWSQAHLAPGSQGSLPGHAMAMGTCQRPSALMRLLDVGSCAGLAGGSGCQRGPWAQPLSGPCTGKLVWTALCLAPLTRATALCRGLGPVPWGVGPPVWVSPLGRPSPQTAAS